MEHPEPPTIPDDDDALLAECDIQTFRAGGKGGQHQNTTDSGVRLVHRPTGIRVESRSDRSQHRNRRLALERLRTRLEALAHTDPERVPTRVPPREKRKRRDEKRRWGETKKLRRRPPPEPE